MCLCNGHCLAYPNEKAVHVVLRTVRDWLEDLKKRNEVIHLSDIFTVYVITARRTICEMCKELSVLYDCLSVNL